MQRKSFCSVCEKNIVCVAVVAALVVSSVVNGTAESKRVTALIVDNTNVETEVTNLESNDDMFGGFGGYDLSRDGFSITIKKIMKSPGEDIVVEYDLWLFFGQIKTIIVDKEVDKGYKDEYKVKVSLNNNSSIEGVPSLFLEFRGTCSMGEFQIPLNKVKSMIIKSAPSIELDQISSKSPPGTRVRKGIIELRDGSKIEAKDVRRYYTVFSGGSSKHYNDTRWWIKFIRGGGLVKTSIPFEKIKEIIFDKGLNEKGRKLVKVTLSDGTLLSGSCGGDGDVELINYITGISDSGIFVIFMHEDNIKSIKFVD